MRNMNFDFNTRDFQKFQAMAETVAERLGDVFQEVSKGINVEAGTSKLRMDIAEDDAHVFVYMELPGVAKEQVNVTMSEDGTLTVSGEKQRPAHDGKKFIRVERGYGSFSRSVKIEQPVQTDLISAEFRDGILTITLPKPESAQPKTVKINIQ